MLAALFVVATVVGSITMDGTPLPGCTVRLSSGSFSATAISDANGSYRFDSVPPGDARLEFSLEGLSAVELRIDLKQGVNAAPNAQLKPLSTDTITIAEPACGDEDSPWLIATCRDYDFDSALIDAASKGDRSAVDLLRQRSTSVVSLYEQNRIAGALLGRLNDDWPFWNRLEADAKNALRFDSADDSRESVV